VTKERFETHRREGKEGGCTLQAEIRVVQPLTRERWQSPEAGRDKKWDLL
jgi:hypothetical protein